MTPNYLPINRELKDKERLNQLFQKRRLKLKTENLYDNLSVIKLNSTYLETADIAYAGRGSLSFWYLSIGAIFLVFILFLFIGNFLHDPEWGFFFVSLFMCSAVMFCLWFAFRSDSFCLTHYPIRFNRKNKKVYAFTRDQGIIIAYWEFVRRYMEDGADSVSSIVKFCLPIANKKPSWKYELIFPFASKIAFGPLWLTYLFSPFIFCVCIGRLFSMSTSKIPMWPNDINQECSIDKKDKINLSETINKPWSWKQGWTKEPWCKRMGNPEDYLYFN